SAAGAPPPGHPKRLLRGAGGLSPAESEVAAVPGGEDPLPARATLCRVGCRAAERVAGVIHRHDPEPRVYEPEFRSAKSIPHPAPAVVPRPRVLLELRFRIRRWCVLRSTSRRRRDVVHMIFALQPR